MRVGWRTDLPEHILGAGSNFSGNIRQAQRGQRAARGFKVVSGHLHLGERKQVGVVLRLQLGCPGQVLLRGSQVLPLDHFKEAQQAVSGPKVRHEFERLLEFGANLRGGFPFKARVLVRAMSGQRVLLLGV